MSAKPKPDLIGKFADRDAAPGGQIEILTIPHEATGGGKVGIVLCRALRSGVSAMPEYPPLNSRRRGARSIRRGLVVPFLDFGVTRKHVRVVMSESGSVIVTG